MYFLYTEFFIIMDLLSPDVIHAECPDFGGTVLILTENPESQLGLSRDAKCPDFEKQRSCREVIDQKNSLNGIFRVIL